jgi:hypothetical protein
LVKCKSQSVYDYTAFGRIDKVIEVKSITKLQEKILGIHHHSFQKNNALSGERKAELEDF